MKITIEDKEGRRVTTECPSDEHTIDEVVRELFLPALEAYGFPGAAKWLERMESE